MTNQTRAIKIKSIEERAFEVARVLVTYGPWSNAAGVEFCRGALEYGMNDETIEFWEEEAKKVEAEAKKQNGTH